MTQWKVGDKAEVIKVSLWMKEETDLGDIAAVISIDGENRPIFDVDEDQTSGWVDTKNSFRRLPSPTYETIQINGKLYSLVPVEA